MNFGRHLMHIPATSNPSLTSYQQMQRDQVFSGAGIIQVGQFQIAEMRKAISSLPPESLTEESEPTTLKELVKRFDVPPVTLDKEGIHATEVSRPVRNQRQNTMFLDDGFEPPTQATKIQIKVPFMGDGNFLKLSPNPCNCFNNSITVDGQNVVFEYSPSGSPEDLRARFDNDLIRFDENLDRLTKAANEFNDRLVGEIKVQLQARRGQDSDKRNYLDGLGFPIK